ncbi:MAG: MFS transporter [Solirubrobacterales bacterium]|nr:MFS transporter [Solirubrobacterales bacterium]MBV9534000.1 MFS transporter [Solirubrobacterales bacterium]
MRPFLEWIAALMAGIGRALRGQVVQAVGGPARARVITLFGLVLALSGADAATVGAVAPQLQASLHITIAEIGVLSTVSLLVGALFVIPVGLLVDRIKRMPLLSGSIVLWSVASLASAFAGSYSGLLLTRVFLGAVIATAGPAIASLTGDYFPSRERGRVYAYILGGEVAGSAVGFIVSGTVASAISWRAAFVLLAIPGFFLARTLWRTVPEPLRGGQSRLEPGVEDLHQAVAEASVRLDWEWEEPGAPREGELAREAAQRRGVEPDPQMVLEEDPRAMGMVRSIRYILSVPSNVMMIISSALGYFFFSGLQTFALLFIRGHYNVGQATAEVVLLALVIASLVGTLISGRLTDAMLRRGMLTARIWVPAVCYLTAAGLLVPGILIGTLTPALWFTVGGAALLMAANPPLDAARLDIMSAGLWGRAESTRTFLRSLAQAVAPVAFGGVASLIAGFVPAQAPVGTRPGGVSAAEATGLEITFLIMLTALFAAGVFLLYARRTYPRDVATAAASNQGGQRRPTPAARGRTAA